MKMTGINKKGTYMTKADEIKDTVKAAKSWSAEWNKASSSRKKALATMELTRLERKLMECGMSEEEIENAIYG